MDKSNFINFNENIVSQLEILASVLEGFNYSKEDNEIKFLTLILNIESLLPNSNIFNYVFKRDIYKEELDNIDEKMWELKNRLSDIHNDIEDSEWKVETDTNEEFIFNKIKQKLITEKKLNYGTI